MSNDSWNQENAWAEQDRAADDYRWSDSAGHADEDWAEDLRTGAAYELHGETLSLPQSGLGIASLIVSIVAGLMIAISLAIAVALLMENPNPPEDSPAILGVGCTLMAGLMLAIVAGLLGAIGLFQPDRSKTCATLGVLFAAIEVFGIVGLFVIGLLAG